MTRPFAAALLVLSCCRTFTFAEDAKKESVFIRSKSGPNTNATSSPHNLAAQKPGKLKLDIHANLRKPVTLKAPYPESYSGAPTDRISVQYAVMEILKQVEIDYDFDQSQSRVGEIAKRWIKPTIAGKSCEAALKEILEPLDLSYDLADGKLFLKKK